MPAAALRLPILVVWLVVPMTVCPRPAQPPMRSQTTKSHDDRAMPTQASENTTRTCQGSGRDETKTPLRLHNSWHLLGSLRAAYSHALRHLVRKKKPFIAPLAQRHVGTQSGQATASMANDAGLQYGAELHPCT